jgi:hypothetical protein
MRFGAQWRHPGRRRKAGEPEALVASSPRREVRRLVLLVEPGTIGGTSDTVDVCNLFTDPALAPPPVRR